MSLVSILFWLFAGFSGPLFVVAVSVGATLFTVWLMGYVFVRSRDPLLSLGALRGSEKLIESANPQSTALTITEKPKSKLDFEIDEQVSQVRVGNGNREICRIHLELKLRCIKEVDWPVAVKAFHASLHKFGEDGSETTVVDQEDSQVSRTFPKLVVLPADEMWTIREPDSGFRIYQFIIEITRRLQANLSPDHFLRVTMNAIGQEPISQTVFVDDWTQPISAVSRTRPEELPLRAQKEINRLKDELTSYEKTVERLGRYNEEYRPLIDLARKQKTEIDEWVKVKECGRGDLNIYPQFGEPRNVILYFWVTNKSVLDISLSDDLGGVIKFQSMELTDSKKVINSVKDIPSGETACLTIKQRLTPSEVQTIIDAEYSVKSQYFNFDELKVMIVGGKRSPDITAKPLKIGSAFANAYPIDLLERGQRLRALSEIRGGAVQLHETLRIETSEALPTEVIERWATVSQDTLQHVYKTEAAKRLWRELTHGDPIPTSAAAQREWLKNFFITLGGIIASEYGEYIRQPQR